MPVWLEIVFMFALLLAAIYLIVVILYPERF